MSREQTFAGFVLAGGESRRMGRDKGLLRWRGGLLIEHVARGLATACGSAVVIGHAERYGGLGFETHSDATPGSGPLGGVCTALALGRADWNIVLGCDMPLIDANAVRVLMDEALLHPRAAAVLAASAAGPEPLCAVYHASALPRLEQALREGRLRMREAALSLTPVLTDRVDAACFTNVNTAAEWEALRGTSK